MTLLGIFRNVARNPELRAGGPATHAPGTNVAAALNDSFITFNTPRERMLGELEGAPLCLCAVLPVVPWSAPFVLRGQRPSRFMARWRRVALWAAGALLPTAAGFSMVFEVRMRQVASVMSVGPQARPGSYPVKSGRH